MTVCIIKSKIHAAKIIFYPSAQRIIVQLDCLTRRVGWRIWRKVVAASHKQEFVEGILGTKLPNIILIVVVFKISKYCQVV